MSHGIEWPEHHVNTLRLMAAGGATARDIGVAVGYSRKAVICKAQKFSIPLLAKGPAKHVSPVWNNELVEKLRGLLAKGMTAAQAGKAMGRPRNSVIGAAGRNGIKFLHGSGARDPNAQPKQLRPRQPKRYVQKALGRIVAPVAAVLIGEPLSKRVPLLALERHHCRWIAGDDGLSCGHDRTDGSYCAYHHHIAYPPGRGAVRHVSVTRRGKLAMLYRKIMGIKPAHIDP